LETGIPARLSPAEGRRFGITLGLAFLALAGLLYWRTFPTGSAVTAALGILLLVAGLILPTHLGTVSRGWMKLGAAISVVTTPVFMGVVYFLVLTPTGLIMRMIGRNPLKPARAGGTHWVTRAENHRRSSLDRQF
jgi:hypothetical protein